MALGTLGTAATDTLSAVEYHAVMSVSDLAELNALARDQGTGASTIYPIPMVQAGMLYVPDRGTLKLFEGDWIGIDPVTGMMIVINAASAAGASWVHS